MRLFKDIKSRRLLMVKAALMLICGLLATALLLVLHQDWITAFLLGTAIFGFCRFYYFAFYVIEHYVDSDFKFSGLHSALLYLLGKKNRK